MKLQRVFLLVSATAVASCLTGCSTDVDPHQKVDAPGYYNGPMNAKGGSGATNDKGATATAPKSTTTG